MSDDHVVACGGLSQLLDEQEMWEQAQRVAALARETQLRERVERVDEQRLDCSHG